MTLSATIDVPCFLGKELYAHLTKDVEFPSLPPIGLNVAFKLKAIEQQHEAERYKALVKGCINSTGQVVIESLTYYPQGNSEGKKLYVSAIPATANEEAEIATYIRLMEEFYGFSVELCT